MKKLALAAAIAATISTGAHASSHDEGIGGPSLTGQYSISSTITGSQVLLSSDIELSNALVFGGTINIETLGGAGDSWVLDSDQTGSAATLTGTQSVQAGSATMGLNYNLAGSSTAGGILFDSGAIAIDANGTPYDTVDASVSNLNFDSTGTWQTLSIGGIDMSGGTVNADGTITIAFNGLWSGLLPLGYADSAVAASLASGEITVFGNSALYLLEGELTLTAVPVSAAAWLFGSALIGLAGIRRKK